MKELPPGYVARIIHWRFVEEQEGLVNDVHIRSDNLTRLPHGGMTTAFIYLESTRPDTDWEPVAEGDARCLPTESYNRKIGRDIALGRALKQLDVREEAVR